MKFITIQPRIRTVEIIECAQFVDAVTKAGLNPGDIDHGRVVPGIAYAVSEMSMFEPPERQSYFALDRTLYSGNAVLYGVGSRGETIDLSEHSMHRLQLRFGSAAQMQQLMRDGVLDWPEMKINGEVFWRWPDPRPDMNEWVRRVTAGGGGLIINDGEVVITTQPAKKHQ